jgi:antitoxin component of MazEF toxin-antitoxin module
MEVFTNEHGEAVVQLPDQMILDLDWQEGDELDWDINDDGTVTLTKVKKSKKNVNTEWVLVECISQFRHRYMVEVPAGKAEYALDTVTMNEAKEMSQHHLGEVIISHRVVTEDEAIAQAYEDNDYLVSWSEEQIKKNLFTHWEKNGKVDKDEESQHGDY